MQQRSAIPSPVDISSLAASIAALAAAALFLSAIAVAASACEVLAVAGRVSPAMCASAHRFALSVARSPPVGSAEQTGRRSPMRCSFGAPDSQDGGKVALAEPVWSTRRFLRAVPCCGAGAVAFAAAGKASLLAEAPGKAGRETLALSGRAETKARTNLSSMFDSRSQLSSSGLCPRHLTKNSRPTASVASLMASREHKLGPSYHCVSNASVRIRVLPPRLKNGSSSSPFLLTCGT
jgi:hypothetical protein